MFWLSTNFLIFSDPTILFLYIIIFALDLLFISFFFQVKVAHATICSFSIHLKKKKKNYNYTSLLFFLQSEQKKFLQQHKTRSEIYSKAVTTVKKQRKKSRGSSKSGIAMDKELKNMQILEEEKSKLDIFCEQSLKNVLTLFVTLVFIIYCIFSSVFLFV